MSGKRRKTKRAGEYYTDAEFARVMRRILLAPLETRLRLVRELEIRLDCYTAVTTWKCEP